jgi:HK97 family phage portal protein
LLSKDEYRDWCRQLEEKRSSVQAASYPSDPMPVEIAPGRGDMNFSSGGWGYVPEMITSLALVGRTVSYAALYRKQPWVGAAVRTILELSSRIPLKIYEKIGDDATDRRELSVGDDPLAASVNAPWNRGSGLSLTMAQLGPLLVHGNAVTTVDSAAGGRIEFAPKDWRFAMPIMPWRDMLVGFRFDIDMGYFTFDAPIDKVLHVSWWDPMGPTQGSLGVSPLEQLQTTLTIEDAAQRYQAALFANGARPPSALETSEQFLGLKQAERDQVFAQMRKDLIDIYSGPDNAGKPALLPPGVTWNAVGQSTVEAELVGQRLLTREEVGGVYRLPPAILNAVGQQGNPYARIDLLREMVYPDCIGPKLVLVENAINAQIFRDLLGRPEIFVEYDFSAVLRGTYLTQITALRAAIGSGLLTPNEGRKKLGERVSSQEGMDDYYLPTNNLSPVGADTGTDLNENANVTGDRGTTPQSLPADASADDEVQKVLAQLEEVVR